MEELARKILRIWVVSRVLVLQDLVEKHVKLVRNIDHKNSKMSTRLNPSCISHIWIVVVFRCFWLNPVSKVRGGCGNQQACVTNIASFELQSYAFALSNIIHAILEADAALFPELMTLNLEIF